MNKFEFSAEANALLRKVGFPEITEICYAKLVISNSK